MKLFNTLTRKKHTFKPLKKDTVSLYTCGPTVYNYSHIGNLRTYIFADVLERSLEYEGYRVKRVMNITDVGHLTSDSDTGEDKLEKGALREGGTVWQIAYRFRKAFFRDTEKLNIKKPATVVKATDTVSHQIKLIERLTKKGYAYETGHALYFDISKFKSYGKLSGQSLRDKLVASREEVVEDSEKRHPADFSLWFKLVGRHKNHTMHWPSPWGEGFPGWHIECSAISSKYLGQPFDIHTGGVDHIGTHHANEIAQSEAAFGKPLAKFWMHGEFLIIDKQKMAKSRGGFITLADVEQKGFEPLAYRYLALTAHYRSKLHFSWENLESATNAYHNLIDALVRTRSLKKSASASAYIKRFQKYISDDLDTPQALAVLWEATKDTQLSQQQLLKFIKEADKVFGLDLIKQAQQLTKQQSAVPTNIKKQAQQRWEYRKNREFKKADAIRLRLAKLGYEIQDQDKEYTIKKVEK